jgi:hypothetical protein
LRDSNNNFGAFIWWMKNLACFCIYPHCRSTAYVSGVYVILILRA